jgi:hypothetical protein
MTKFEHQRRWVFKQEITRDPKANDSEVARRTKTDRETVANTRSEMINPAETGNNDYRPIERTKGGSCAPPRG